MSKPDTEIDELEVVGKILHNYYTARKQAAPNGVKSSRIHREAKQAIQAHYARQEAEIAIRARIDELDNVQILYEGGHDFVGYIEDELEKLKKKRIQLTSQAEQEKLLTEEG